MKAHGCGQVDELDVCGHSLEAKVHAGCLHDWRLRRVATFVKTSRGCRTAEVVTGVNKPTLGPYHLDKRRDSPYSQRAVKSDAERGEMGRRLRAAREAHGYRSGDEGQRALAAAGVAISPTTYREFEAGTRIPRPELVERIEAVWGALPSAQSASDPIVVAIEAATARLEALLLPLSEGQEARLRALEAELAALRERSADAASPGRHAPRETMG